jgi:GH24 family phage-related lysozyme (muramidase)
MAQSRLAEIYRAEKEKGGGVFSTVGKRTLEKIDPRQLFNQRGFLAAALPSLFKAYSATSRTSSKTSSGVVPSFSSASMDLKLNVLIDEMSAVKRNTTIFTKNSMSLPGIAYDMNIMKQNFAKFIKKQGIAGEKKGDMFFKNAAQREKDYKTKFSKTSATATTPGSADTKSSGFLGSIGGGLGLAALGAGIGGFLAALAAGGAAAQALGGGEGIKSLLVNLAEGLGAFSSSSLLALGALLGTGMLFGAYAGAGKSIGGGVGIAAIGLGIGGFMAGLSAGGALSEMIGGSAGVRDMLVNLAEGLNAFSSQSLIAMGALLAPGMLFGAVGAVGGTRAAAGGATGAFLGITAVGLGISGFLLGLSGAAKVIDMFGGAEPLKNLFVNLAGGLEAFGNVNGNNLLAIAAALPVLGATMAAFLGAEGLGKIAGHLKSAGAAALGFFGIKTDGSPSKEPSIFERIALSLAPLQSVNGENLSKVGQGLKDLASGMLGLAQLDAKGVQRAENAASAAGRTAARAGAAGMGGTSPTPAGAPTSTSPTAAPQAGNVSEQLVNFVKKKEGFSAKAFWDHKQYSIGYGTKANGPDEVIDEAEADRRLREHLEKTQKAVVEYGQQKGYNWNQNQVDALSSFVYNLGTGALDQVTKGGTRTDSEIADAILKYNKASGQVNAGLTKRRNEELAMFTSMPASPSSGSAIGSGSIAAADASREAMIPVSSGGNVVNTTTNNNVAQSSGQGKPASVYDAQIAEAMLGTLSA